MAKPSKLDTGDRVAYAAKFLKNTGQFASAPGQGGQRRGTFLAYDRHHDGFARVHWDDLADKGYQAFLSDQYGDDYLADALANGQLVCASNIAKVGSPRFASNDL